MPSTKDLGAADPPVLVFVWVCDWARTEALFKTSITRIPCAAFLIYSLFPHNHGVLIFQFHVLLVVFVVQKFVVIEDETGRHEWPLPSQYQNLIFFCEFREPSGTGKKVNDSRR